MEGRCPGCNRAYDISEEFLSMGGKAKCPHCLLELEFEQSRASASVDRFYDVTRADDRDHHRLSYEEAAEEVDSHCPSCERRFKVDRKYLETGGAAQCPHCAVDLVFDSAGAPAEEPRDYGTETEGVDDWGESGEISLPELDELRVPTTMEEPPAGAAEEEEEEEYEDESVAFDQEEEEEPAREDVHGAGTEEEDLADELPTQMMDRPPPDELQEDFADEPAPLEEPADLAAPGQEARQPSVGLAEELFGDQAGEGGVEEDLAESSASKAGGPVVLEERPSSPHGPFGALASNEDWASAAARWAESGFKADEMPSFIKGGSEVAAEPGEKAGGVHAEPALPGGELLISEAAEGTVEVSDADIMMLEASEADILPEPAPTGEGSTWAEAASEEIKARRAEKPPMAKAERAAQQPSVFAKLKSPWMLAAVLGGAVVLAGVLLWALLGGGEDVAAYTFPGKGLKASVVQAPPPSGYKAKEEAVEHYGLGNRLAYHGKFEDAILEYKQALRLDPGYPHPHRALGAIYAALGKPKLSASSYETYLRLSPHSADAGQVRQIIKATGGK
jgi:tetratricopeptide (TPR) repeat protein